MFSDGTIIKERYQIVSEIARGGMGIVYLVKDLLVEDEAALKVSLWQHEELRKAFLREAKFLVKLNHRGLPKVRDYFVEGEKQILVMDFVRGESLRQRIANPANRTGKGLSLPEILGITEQLCAVLNFLHTQNPPIVHRDIKPENIKIRPDGQIVLLDFGLAKDSEMSVPAVSMSYSSPEQISRTGTSPQSDIYSLGATLYHLLTGEMPTSATFRVSNLYDNKGDNLLTVHQRNAEIPIEVSDKISWAMEIPEKKRPASALEFWQSLQAFSAEKTNLHDTNPLEVSVVSPIALPDEKSDILPKVEESSPTVFPDSPKQTLFSKTFLLILASLLLGLLMFAGIAFVTVFISQQKSVSTATVPAMTPQTEIQTPLDLPPDFVKDEVAPNQTLTVNMFWKTRNRGEVKVAPENIFRSGDELRLGINSANDGYFYLVTRDLDGNAALLYPIGDVTNEVKANHDFRLPESTTMTFGDVKSNIGAYTTDKLYFIFAENQDEEIVRQINEVFGNKLKGQKLRSEYKSGDLPNIKNLVKNLDESAKTSDIKSTEIKFDTKAKTLVGTFDVRSAGR